MSVNVATPAKVELKVTVKEQQKEKVVWGEEVQVVCQVTTPGNPSPSLQLKLESKELTSVITDQGQLASTSHFPTLQESGQRYVDIIFIYITDKFITLNSLFPDSYVPGAKCLLMMEECCTLLRRSQLHLML